MGDHGHAHGGAAVPNQCGDNCQNHSHGAAVAHTGHGHAHGGLRPEHVVVELEDGKRVNVQDALIALSKSSNATDENGAPTNMMFGAEGWTVFDVAKNGNTDALEVLMQDGVDIHQTDEQGATIMHWAAMSGVGGIVTFLCKNGLNVNAKAKGGGNDLTPLMWAVNHHHVTTLKELVEMGADLEARDKQGYTALMYAGMKGHVHLMHCLVKAGAAITTMDDARHTILHWAVYKGHASVVQYLSLFHPQVCRMLEIDDIERNAVHWACRTGHLDCTRNLAAANPSDFLKALQARDDEGKSPLQLAKDHSHTDIIKWVECMTKTSATDISSTNNGMIVMPTNPNDQRKALLVTVDSITSFFKSAGSILAFFCFAAAALPAVITLPFVFWFIWRANAELSHKMAKSTPIDATRLFLPGIWFGMGSLGYVSLVFGHFLLGVTMTSSRVVYIICNVILTLHFFQLMVSDPGCIPDSKAEFENVLEELIERDGKSPPWFACVFNLAGDKNKKSRFSRAPPRSKISTVFGCRVGRYDHHCLWLQNVIGYNNHRSFIVFIFWHLFVQIWNALICYQLVSEMDGFHLATMVSVSRASLYIILILLNTPLCFLAFYTCLSHMSCIMEELTSHEADNYVNLWYIQANTSPYSRASKLANVIAFFNMSDEYGDPYHMPPKGSVRLEGEHTLDNDIGRMDLEWWNPVKWMEQRRKLQAMRVMDRPSSFGQSAHDNC